jgi:hypothetical protein
VVGRLEKDEDVLRSSMSGCVINRFLRDAIKMDGCLFVPIWQGAMKLEAASDLM